MSPTSARTPRWLTATLALPLAVALLAGCGDDDSSTDAASTDAEATGDGAPAEDVTVDIVSTVDGFDPTTTEVSVGSEVTWTNSDDTVHTATADDGTWDSGKLDGGEEFSFTAEEAGTYSYVCDIHPSMKGELVVR